MAGFRLNTLIRHPEQAESTTTGNHSILALSNDRQFVYGVAAVLFSPPSPRSYFLQIGNTNDYGNRIYPKSARLIFIDRTG